MYIEQGRHRKVIFGTPPGLGRGANAMHPLNIPIKKEPDGQ